MGEPFISTLMPQCLPEVESPLDGESGGSTVRLEPHVWRLLSEKLYGFLLSFLMIASGITDIALLASN